MKNLTTATTILFLGLFFSCNSKKEENPQNKERKSDLTTWSKESGSFYSHEYKQNLSWDMIKDGDTLTFVLRDSTNKVILRGSWNKKTGEDYFGNKETRTKPMIFTKPHLISDRQ